MLSIPLYAAAIVYLAFLFVFLVFLSINVRHLMLTGSNTAVSFLVTFIVLILIILTCWQTWNFLQSADWQRPLVIWDQSWMGSANNNF